MIRFNNDYNRGAFDCILKALADTNTTSYPGYGEDEWCDKAEQIIKGLIGRDIPGATQANYVVVAAALSPVQSVIAADTGHINCHEAASIENTGHKILALPNTDGKISAAQIEACAAEYYDNAKPEYLTEPKMVYISHPTEVGTLYTKAELEDISTVCKECGLYLFLDGARMGYGLMAPGTDVTLPDIAKCCDVFYIGGTKVGALFGEAVVITNPCLKQDFRYCIKQKGGMLAKGRLLGVQFLELFKDGLYFEISKHAIDMAMLLKDGLKEKGYEFFMDSDTNQQFIIVEDAKLQEIRQKYGVTYQERYDETHSVIRLCTSWATKEENVKAFLQDM